MHLFTSMEKKKNRITNDIDKQTAFDFDDYKNIND